MPPIVPEEPAVSDIYGEVRFIADGKNHYRIEPYGVTRVLLHLARSRLYPKDITFTYSVWNALGTFILDVRSKRRQIHPAEARQMVRYRSLVRHRSCPRLGSRQLLRRSL